MSDPPVFWRPVDMAHTALLLTDVQEQVLSRMTPGVQKTYVETIKGILDHFRSQITVRRRAQKPISTTTPDNPMSRNEGIPLIIHHLIPMGHNSHAWISPYNKIFSTWASKRLGGLQLPPGATDPETPWFAIPDALKPPPPPPSSDEALEAGAGAGAGAGWNVDEVVLGKIRVSSFSDSVLLGYLRARDIKHVVLCGLSTDGAVLSSVRAGADLDFHIIVPRDGCWGAEEEVHELVMEKLIGRFADVVGVEDVLRLV